MGPDEEQGVAVADQGGRGRAAEWGGHARDMGQVVRKDVATQRSSGDTCAEPFGHLPHPIGHFRAVRSDDDGSSVAVVQAVGRTPDIPFERPQR